MNFKTFKKWFLIIFPPLLLLPLIFIPGWDEPEWLFWGAGYIAFIVAVARIFRNLIRAAWRTIRKQNHGIIFGQLIRSFLVVILFPSVMFIVNLSMSSADTYARELSRTIQNECRLKSACPSQIAGWTRHQGAADILWVSTAREIWRTAYGEYGAKYPIIYRVSPDKTRFTIIVSHSRLAVIFISGGVNEELKESKDRY